MKSLSRRKILLIGLVACLILFKGCTGNEVADSAIKCADNITKYGNCNSPSNQSENVNLQIAGQSQKAPPTEQSDNAGQTIEESRVYLDASQSMRGFAAPKENNKFVALLESIGYAMPNHHLFKYGLASKDIAPNITNIARKINVTQEFRNEQFYSLEHNPDDVLINFLASEEKPVRSVLITDGVYSAPAAELQSEVANAIGTWMSKGRFFGILIFNSPFQGKLYSENKRGWIDGVNIEKRPFYAFVFSPDEKGFIELRDKLSSEFSNIKTLSFPKETARCLIEPKTKVSVSLTRLPPKSPYYLYIYAPEIFNQNNSADLYYDFNCTPAKDYPLGEFALNVVPHYYSWQNNSFIKNDKSPPFDISLPEIKKSEEAPPATPASSPVAEETPKSKPEAAKKGNLKITLNKDFSSPHSFYHFIFELSGKSLLPEIRHLSTPDDSIAAHADKTYRFYEFMSAVTTIHLRNKEAIKLPEPLFVVLTN